MKQFLLFAGGDHDAVGGFKDFVIDTDTVEEAELKGKALLGPIPYKPNVFNIFYGCDWWHVVDSHTGEIVADSYPIDSEDPQFHIRHEVSFRDDNNVLTHRRFFNYSLTRESNHFVSFCSDRNGDVFIYDKEARKALGISEDKPSTWEYVKTTNAGHFYYWSPEAE